MNENKDYRKRVSEYLEPSRSYTTEERTGTRTYHEFEGKNAKGEKIAFELSYCEPDNSSKNSLPNLWKKHGHTNKVYKSYWCVDVYATDSNNYCWGRYNPTHKRSEDGKRSIINFDWLLDATDENKQKLIKEIERLAFEEVARYEH